jgi:hypothetical protein
MTDWSAMSNRNANNAVNANTAINDYRAVQFSRGVLGIQGINRYSPAAMKFSHTFERSHGVPDCFIP